MVRLLTRIFCNEEEATQEVGVPHRTVEDRLGNIMEEHEKTNQKKAERFIN